MTNHACYLRIDQFLCNCGALLWICTVVLRQQLKLDLLSADLVGYLGFRSTGVEVRGNSAFDIALWDIFGKTTGLPVAQLLGGFTRREIRTYNTCAGTDYVRKTTGQVTANYGLTDSNIYDDLNGFHHRAARRHGSTDQHGRRHGHRH